MLIDKPIRSICLYSLSNLLLICIASHLVHAEQPSHVAVTSSTRTTLKVPTKPAQNASPLVPAIDLALRHYNYSRKNIRDYSCIIVRQERIDGQLRPHEFMQAKVRNRRTKNGKIAIPFSVHLKFLKPSTLKGREVLYVEGMNAGDMLVRNGGKRFAYITTRLKPDSNIAMRENRYPITELGIENLTRRLILSAKEHLAADCSVRVLEDATLNNRTCRELVITNNDRAQELPFKEVRVFIDQELQMPVHYEAYDWPIVEGGEPILLERYTYLKVKTNQGFSDFDFDPKNPEINVE